MPYNIHLLTEASDFADTIFSCAPNLRKILGLVEPNTLKVLPANKLGLITKFMLDISSEDVQEDLEICRKLGRKRRKECSSEKFPVQSHGNFGA